MVQQRHRRRPLLVGVDSGGTSTRAIVFDEELEIVGVAASGGGNRWSSGGKPWETICDVIEAALPDGAGSDVCAAAIGVSSSLGSGVHDLSSLGISCIPMIVDDSHIAFVAGSDASDGLLLIAGTGAGCFTFRSWSCVHQVDGHGWLFGDKGSAVWIGRMAIEAALEALDGRGPQTALEQVVATDLRVPLDQPARAVCNQLTCAQMERSPSSLGNLAHTVIDLADRDEVAARIVKSAVDHLVATVRTAIRHDDLQFADLITCGSVAGSAIVFEQLRTDVGIHFDMQVLHVRDGVAGAVLLALRQRGRTVSPQARAHLFATVDTLREGGWKLPGNSTTTR